MFELVVPEIFDIEKHRSEIDVMLDSYERMVFLLDDFIKSFEAGGYSSIMGLFFEKGEVNNLIIDKSVALGNLNSKYWSQLISFTKLFNIMPADRKAKWNKMLGDNEAPMFTRELVYGTIEALSAAQGRFFAERVDGVFRSLSKGHLTNRPEGFYKRMIFKGVIENFTYGWVDSSMKEYLTDLRSIVNTIFNEGNENDQSYSLFSSTTSIVLKEAISNYGDWMFFDGGALKIKVFKNGNAHVEVHPEVAFQLNRQLHLLYPSAIPSEFRSVPKVNPKEFMHIEKPIPAKILNILANMDYGLKKSDSARRDYDRDTNTLSLKATYHSSVKKMIDEIIFSIGGIPFNGYQYNFESDPMPALKKVIVMGRIPEDKTHQYYPTPDEIAEYVASIANVKPEETVLEPSAGTGSLIVKLPEHAKVTAIEISDLRATYLKTFKNVETVIAKDFLTVENSVQYDKIVMNPPFNGGRAKSHVSHAFGMLKPGGTLVAVVPTSFHEKFEGGEVVDLKTFNNCFQNTNISVKVIKINKEF